MSAGGDRSLVGGLAVLAVLALGALWSLRGETVEPSLPLHEQMALDSRIRRLTDDCGMGMLFQEDTSNLVPALVSKLEKGMSEPLKMATRELARIGAPAVPELKRLYDSAAATPFMGGVVKNVVEVCALMEDPAGLEILRISMQHANEAIRLAAADGLTRHGLPEDYERVMGWIEASSGGPARQTYAKALRAMDPDRFRADVLKWLEQGHHADLYPHVADVALGAITADEVEGFTKAASFHDVTPAARLYLIGPAAREGDVVLLEELMATAQSEHPGRVAVALDALSRMGVVEPVEEVLTHDLRVEVRLAALGSAMKVPSPPDRVRLLEIALQDGDPSVSRAALKQLTPLGHEGARARALQLLRGTQAEREAGMEALRLNWSAQPGAAAEAFALLEPELSAVEDRSERISLMQLLSHVPDERVPGVLEEQAAFFQGEVKGIAPHRFLCGLLWNSGAMGRAWLRERLLVETDPLRRLDLIEWIWQDRSPESLETLIGVLQGSPSGADPDCRAYEVLFLADRLAVMGPAQEVAPQIEWAYRECTHPVVRPALQCLLWQWFGDTRFMTR